MYNEVWYQLECAQIERAVVNVSQKLGRGLHMSAYQEELRNEFCKLRIPYSDYNESETAATSTQPAALYQPDFICHGVIAVKINVLTETHHEHKPRISTYLKSSQNRLAILANFGTQPYITVEKITR